MPPISQQVSQQLSRRLATVVLMAGAVGLGCDDLRRADRRVEETIHASRLARMEEGGAEKSRTLLDQAAKDSEAGAASKAQVKSLLGYAQLEAANERINHPDDGVNQGNREIARLLWEIGQLAQQIQGSNTLVDSYAQLEPKDAKAAAAAQEAAATGGPDKPVWIGENTTAIPTIAAAQQKVAQLQDEIARQQQAIEALNTTRTQAAAQAAQLQRQSESQKGRDSLDTFRSASEMRKKAADTQNQIDVESSKLARLQQDAALAAAQLATVGKAKEQFQTISKNLDTTWTGVQAQVAKQKSVAAEILGGAKESSVASKAAQLAKQTAKTKEAYDKAEESLNEAIKSFEEAGTNAAKLTAELRQSMSTIPSDNQLKKAMDQLVLIYNPNVFKLSQAHATLALAQLQASRAQVLAERATIVAKLGEVVKQAGLALPKELDDPKLADDLKAAATAADEKFADTQKLYEDVEQAGGGAESDRNAGRAGHIYSLYGRALLGRATGNTKAADEHLANAKAQRDTAMQEAKGSLTALPAELVVLAGPTPPAPTTAATAPATTEGATTTPAEGATTTPAETATPATPAP